MIIKATLWEERIDEIQQNVDTKRNRIEVNLYLRFSLIQFRNGIILLTTLFVDRFCRITASINEDPLQNDSLPALHILSFNYNFASVENWKMPKDFFRKPEPDCIP